MNALILAGGRGARLAPLTDAIPKPMLTVANAPMVDYAVSHLWDFGLREFVFTLFFMPEAVIDWAIGYHGAVCRFMLEPEPLGTLGGVKVAEDFLDDTFIVLSGDAIEDINLDAMLHKHHKSGAEVTMAVTEAADLSLYGVPELDAFGFVTGYTEKPRPGTAKSRYANCGVYIVQKSVLSRVPADVKTDFSLDLFPALVAERKLAAFIHDGYWRDLGEPQGYYEANFELLRGGFFPPAPSRRRGRCPNRWIGEPHQSLLAASAQVLGAVKHSVIGADAIILPDARIDSCVVLEGATASGTHQNAIVGRDFVLQVSPQGFSQNRHLAVGFHSARR
ncbi:MAG: NDP-sugar synthase [Firmicutes bacterium]|nr:NDP-sugar synthase [Bacillota bacterium]